MAPASATPALVSSSPEESDHKAPAASALASAFIPVDSNLTNGSMPPS